MFINNLETIAYLIFFLIGKNNKQNLNTYFLGRNLFGGFFTNQFKVICLIWSEFYIC